MRITSSMTPVTRWVPIDGIDFSPNRNAEPGRSITKNPASAIRAMRLRSLPRATSNATTVFTSPKT